ncbi:MAG: ferrous iron transport protein B, partial [Spirochaetia bacterium]|nr:ferrous iron transport protein B [Spirochaetia bacterium]
TLRLVDLPGLYSLDTTSPDEKIAHQVITGQMPDLPKPDLVLAVVDASNLERNLYLVTKLLEFQLPVVLALTMVDLARKKGIDVDPTLLGRELGVPVVPIHSGQKIGLGELGRAVLRQVEKKEVSNKVPASIKDSDSGERESKKISARYSWIRGVASRVTRKLSKSSAGLGLDRILTHRIFGPLILVAILLIIFQTIFSWATLPMDLIDKGFGALSHWVRGHLAPGLFTDLLTGGIIAGVGAVIAFLPQILLLFFFISILEDSGYMARAAFIMDRLMRGVGLHGKAFMPLLSSFACAIPGIMSTRTIESPKDRLATILIAPFMSCSARLPVYTLMVAAFFAQKKVFGFISVGALLILGMYILGITVAIIVAWVLKHTILKAPTPPLVLELPPYRLPSVFTIVQHMIQRAGLFLQKAGTVILAISILLWALASFPRIPENAAHPEGHKSEQLQKSFAGQGGKLLEPFIAPLGFDWKMGVGLIASFAARETLVSTFSIMYNADEETVSPSLIDAVRKAKAPDGKPSWTPLVALSMMVFFVLAMQCMSTVAVVRRETNGWRWPIFMIVYMTALAWAAAFLTYQGGKLLGFA